MGIIFENSLKVSPENPIVIDYHKTVQAHTMPQMHYHPYYEIYVLVSGRRKYFFQNKILELEPRDVLVVKPNDAHRAIPINKGPYERYVIDIDPSVFSQIEKYNKEVKNNLNKNFLHLNEKAFFRLLNTIKDIEKEKMRSYDKYRYSIRNHIERILIELLLYDNGCDRTNSLKKNDVRLQEALDYIDSNFNQNITIDVCAKISCMSKSNFARVFHDVIGTNFKEYINSVRIKKSTELLTESDKTISEIAQMVGYDSMSYFGYIFKNVMGVSPKDYRNQFFSK